MTQSTTDRSHGAVQRTDGEAVLRLDSEVFETLSLHRSSDSEKRSSRVDRWLGTWARGRP